MNKDKLGIFLSIGCLIHCLLMPIILPILPLLGLTTDHESIVHIILAVFVIIIATVTIIPGYFEHKNLLTLLTGMIGSIFIYISGILEIFGVHSTVFITMAGSSMMVYSHYNNHKRLCSCKHHNNQ